MCIMFAHKDYLGLHLPLIMYLEKKQLVKLTLKGTFSKGKNSFRKIKSYVHIKILKY